MRNTLTLNFQAPTKMAIGVEGGFNVSDMEKYDTEETVSLAVYRANGDIAKVAFPNTELPTFVIDAANAVIKHAGFDSTKESLTAWEEEAAKESKYAKDLVQLDNGKTLSPDSSKWKCEETGVTENLWLNLSTGFVGSGRKQWDGSGGNGAAERHFEATGSQYPLCVKLGTITPQGGDVYSYAKDESDMVSIFVRLSVLLHLPPRPHSSPPHSSVDPPILTMTSPPLLLTGSRPSSGETPFSLGHQHDDERENGEVNVRDASGCEPEG
jgi:hypothetical protein